MELSSSDKERIQHQYDALAYNQAFAAFLLSIVPIMIFYLLMQKQIMEGLAAGAVKG